MTTPDRALCTSGTVILLAVIASEVGSLLAPYDTPRREAWGAAFAAAALLTMAWTAAAGLFAGVRWRETSAILRVLLALNGFLALAFLWGFVTNFGAQ